MTRVIDREAEEVTWQCWQALKSLADLAAALDRMHMAGSRDKVHELAGELAFIADLITSMADPT